ncbi:hypothetical protein C8Q80DRAFT_1116738 [Daedaleopsis nitida]|nr:hypothetical protein C8Q80DRAFT_1116738 [Daedaleopsis nitida]
MAQAMGDKSLNDQGLSHKLRYWLERRITWTTQPSVPFLAIPIFIAAYVDCHDLRILRILGQRLGQAAIYGYDEPELRCVRLLPLCSLSLVNYYPTTTHTVLSQLDVEPFEERTSGVDAAVRDRPSPRSSAFAQYQPRLRLHALVAPDGFEDMLEPLGRINARISTLTVDISSRMFRPVNYALWIADISQRFLESCRDQSAETVSSGLKIVRFFLHPGGSEDDLMGPASELDQLVSILEGEALRETRYV